MRHWLFLPWRSSETHNDAEGALLANLWIPACGGIITAQNFTKIAKVKKCGRKCDQGAVVYLLWSLKSKARDGAAEEPVFEETYLPS